LIVLLGVARIAGATGRFRSSHAIALRFKAAQRSAILLLLCLRLASHKGEQSWK